MGFGIVFSCKTMQLSSKSKDLALWETKMKISTNLCLNRVARWIVESAGAGICVWFGLFLYWFYFRIMYVCITHSSMIQMESGAVVGVAEAKEKHNLAFAAAGKTSRNVTGAFDGSCSSSRNSVWEFHRSVLWLLQHNPICMVCMYVLCMYVCMYV